MEELIQPVFGDMPSLEGSVSTSVSQQVHLADQQIVSQVFVKEGQEVKEGDPLLSYDMTLVNLDLEMEKLNKEQLEVKKKGLEQEIKKLKEDEVRCLLQKMSINSRCLQKRQKVGCLWK